MLKENKNTDSNQKALQTFIEIFDNLLGSVREPLMLLDSKLNVVKANQTFYKTFNVNPDNTIGTLIYNLGNGQWDIPKLRKLLENILPQQSILNDFEVEHKFETIGHKIMHLNARCFFQETEHTQLILIAIEDVTEREYYKRNLEEIVKHRTSELIIARKGVSERISGIV